MDEKFMEIICLFFAQNYFLFGMFIGFVIFYAICVVRYIILLNHTKKVVDYYYNKINIIRSNILDRKNESKWEKEGEFEKEFSKINDTLNEMENLPRKKDLFFKFNKWSFKSCYPEINEK